MFFKSSTLLHIALIPLYISLASYFNLLPASLSNNLSSLLRLAKTNLRTQYLASLSRNLSTESAMSEIKLVARRSEERGHADHGWLKTFHTFSFASYHDHNHELFGPLRVINEDRVAPHTGFGTHSHREFEIFSYVVNGELEHKDSMGNTEVLKRGDIQLTSAGTGISHSEKAHGSKQVHFLQIWALPKQSRLQPKYYTRHFSDQDKTDKWACVVAPIDAPGVSASREGDGPTPVQNALTLYATMLSAGKTLERPLEGKKGYIHVIQTSGFNASQGKGASVTISSHNGNEMVLREGDGAYIFIPKGGSALKVENTGDNTAEILVFDME